jgi:rhodanese-related sulfurtransferase
MSTIRTCTLDELRALLTQEVLLIESLSPTYYAQGHLPGAINVPVYVSDETLESLSPKEVPVVIYCAGATCPNSRQLAERLIKHGYRDLTVFQEGKPAWMEAGLPLEH